MRTWTEQEQMNAMVYGVCLLCREPRKQVRTEEERDGATYVGFIMGCSEGCPSNERERG